MTICLRHSEGQKSLTDQSTLGIYANLEIIQSVLAVVCAYSLSDDALDAKEPSRLQLSLEGISMATAPLCERRVDALKPRKSTPTTCTTGI